MLRSITRGENVEILKYLLDKGLLINDRCLLFCVGFLHMEADNEMLPILLQQIQDINFVQTDCTFLCRACSFGNIR